MSQVRTGVTVVLAGLLLLVIAASPATAQTATAPPRSGRTLQRTLQFGAPSRLGVSIREVTAADVSDHKLPGEFGAYVTDVTAGGPAEKAGIRAGDVIIEFDGDRVRSGAELERLVRETPAGRAVKVGLIREGKRLEVAVTTEADNNQTFSFQIPMPEFREGPLQPPRRYRLYPEPPSGSFVFPGPIPLRPGTSRLGISLQDLTPQLAEYFKTKDGVLVATVNDGSPASRAGLKAGDIITSIDGRAVSRTEDVTREVRAKRAGEQVALGIVRDGKPRTIVVTL